MRRLTILGTVLAAALTLLGGPALADVLNPTNPIDGTGPWQYSAIRTKANPERLNYLAATDPARRAALAKIALTPRVRWFANCRACNVDRVRQSVAAHVADARRGHPDALVQLAIFGLWPDGEVVNGKRPRMSWSMTRYQSWIRQIALGIGDARVVIVLEPDLAISANHGSDGRTMPDPTPGTRMRMAAWAAKYLTTTLRRETIYLDAGSADWLYVDEALRLLRASGIQYVRGFALGATHYDSVASNVAFAARLSRALARTGIRGKHAVIDTADNGTPFTWSQWNDRWGARFRSTGNLFYQFDNTPTCRSRAERVCQTIGHRPTWNPVGAEAAKLGLGTNQPTLRRQARTFVDAYLWFGRGWRWMQQGGNDPYTPGRSVRMGTYTRFQH
ncbi:MAG TPA: glycoside hydrolase family 6 protein [Nocardioides sp.]|nr:glycoside hydrolase family 6 protein [Nocardioides sp.]